MQHKLTELDKKGGDKYCIARLIRLFEMAIVGYNPINEKRGGIDGGAIKDEEFVMMISLRMALPIGTFMDSCSLLCSVGGRKPKEDDSEAVPNMRSLVDALVSHLLHCKETHRNEGIFRGAAYDRHESVKDLLYAILRECDVNAKKEQKAKGSKRRPGDIACDSSLFPAKGQAHDINMDLSIILLETPTMRQYQAFHQYGQKVI